VTQDEKTFIELYESHHDELHAYCARRVGVDNAADAVADVFTVAWRRIGEVSIEMPRAWLFGVARGVIKNRWRSNRRRRRLVERVMTQRPRLSEIPDALLAQKETDAEIVEAFLRLRPTDQEILRLSAWEELSGPEIAEALGITLSAAQQRLHRAKKRLTASLDRRPGGHSTQEQTA
jgi:RNA polymerase sigma factor (sigma-70 family)